MIPKGNQRAGGQQLAAHLMNSFDNDSVEVAQVRGAVAQDLSGAFAEWQAQSKATNCRKYLYSLSLNPDPRQGKLTREQYLDFIARAEKNLGLDDQPRAIVFHVKNGREHAHVVWSRIDPEKMRAVQLSHDRQKLRSTAQEFARDHGLELPPGMQKNRGKDRLKDRNKVENLAEKQQQERSGISKADRRRDITQAWKTSDNGPAFVQALEARDYILARGDQRAYVVVDLHGEVHSLSRQIEGATARDIKARLDTYPLDKLPDIKAAQATARERQEQLRAREDKEQAPTLEDRRAALQDRHAQRRTDLDQLHSALLARHATERESLKDMQEAENTGIITARIQKQPRGITAFLTRITGIQAFVEYRQKKQDQHRSAQHGEQTDALERRHGREIQDMDRHYKALARLETRENKSLATAQRRERIRQRADAGRTIKPEFDRAAQGVDARKGEGDSRAALKGKAARDFAAALLNKSTATRADLQAAFERAKSFKHPPAGQQEHTEEADPAKLEQSRKTRADLEKRQHEQEPPPKDRDPEDRGR